MFHLLWVFWTLTLKVHMTARPRQWPTTPGVRLHTPPESLTTLISAAFTQLGDEKVIGVSRHIRPSVQLFEGAGFFWKHYCGAPGGPRSAIFATIAHGPLYFEVHTFSDPPPPGLVWSYIQKVEKLAETTFPLRKIWRKKCVIWDDKIPWEKCINHKNLVNFVTKYDIYVCLNVRFEQ